MSRRVTRSRSAGEGARGRPRYGSPVSSTCPRPTRFSRRSVLTTGATRRAARQRDADAATGRLQPTLRRSRRADPTRSAPRSVSRLHQLPSDPAVSYTAVTAAAHNLEAQLAGAGLVGRQPRRGPGAPGDALYAQVLFLFLGLPGAILAAVLTAAVAGAGGVRRRPQQGAPACPRSQSPTAGPPASVEATLVGGVGG